MTIPSGNGETRGPESAGGQGTKLPGTRPSRAAANNARNSSFLKYPADPKPQDGFGTEDMQTDFSYMGGEAQHLADELAPVWDLASMGDASQTFGGV